jgi:hypothetical protein
MLQRVDGLEKLGVESGKHIDCYVSTDTREVEEVFVALGFQDVTGTSHTMSRETLCELYIDSYDGADFGDCSLRHPKTGIEIDCSDIPLEEALRKKEEIGFMAMSQFRVYLNGSRETERILVPLLKGLESEKQNMAFMNDRSSHVFVRLSESYKE